MFPTSKIAAASASACLGTRAATRLALNAMIVRVAFPISSLESTSGRVSSSHSPVESRRFTSSCNKSGAELKMAWASDHINGSFEKCLDGSGSGCINGHVNVNKNARSNIDNIDTSKSDTEGDGPKINGFGKLNGFNKLNGMNGKLNDNEISTGPILNGLSTINCSENEDEISNNVGTKLNGFGSITIVNGNDNNHVSEESTVNGCSTKILLNDDSKNISKNEICRILSAEHGLTLDQSEQIFDTVFDTIIEAVSKSQPVHISNFGKFTTHTLPPRKYRNPQNGNYIFKEERNSVKFTPFINFKESVGSGGRRYTFL